MTNKEAYYLTRRWQQKEGGKNVLKTYTKETKIWQIDTFEGASYDEEFVILEIEVKAALKLFGRNKSPGVGEILI